MTKPGQSRRSEAIQQVRRQEQAAFAAEVARVEADLARQDAEREAEERARRELEAARGEYDAALSAYAESVEMWVREVLAAVGGFEVVAGKYRDADRARRALVRALEATGHHNPIVPFPMPAATPGVVEWWVAVEQIAATARGDGSPTADSFGRVSAQLKDRDSTSSPNR